MGTFNDIRCPVVLANSCNGGAIIAVGALCQEDMRGATKIFGWLAQSPSRQKIFVPKECLAVDEHNFNAVAHSDILQAIVEQQRIGTKTFDGVLSAGYSVRVDEHDDAAQVIGKHEGFVSGGSRIQEKRISIRDHPWRKDGLLLKDR